MNIHFASPLALLLLLTIPALLLWERYAVGWRPSLRMSSVAGAVGMPRTWRQRVRWLPAVLRLAAIAFLVVALARPQSGRADALLPQEGIDIVLVLDTSSSMQMPVEGGQSRLAIAQRVLSEFVAGREHDRLALVTFRSRSFVLSPLTSDYSVFQTLVEGADDIELPNGTAIGLAMTDAFNVLQESKARSRTVILLSDGENNRPEVEPVTAARIAKALGIRVYTIGVTGAGVPAEQASLVSVNEAALTTMAELTDGRYFRASGPEALAQVYDTIDGLERSRVQGERFAAFDELAPYTLGAALALLGAEIVLVTFVLRRMP